MKDTIAFNYELAKQKSKKIKLVEVVTRDEELWGNLGIKDHLGIYGDKVDMNDGHEGRVCE